MCEPKWVIAFGVCASTGGFYQNYSTMPGADQVVPVDVYIPGCPPRPEQVLDALVLLQERIQRGEGHSQVVLKAEKAGKGPGGEYDVPAMSIKPRTDHLAALPPAPKPTSEG
jgi:NADH-quinone oxidoreductase subunit B